MADCLQRMHTRECIGGQLWACQGQKRVRGFGCHRLSVSVQVLEGGMNAYYKAGLDVEALE
jgi:hypothetical protein